MPEGQKKKSPWSFVPTQYFAEGIPFVMVNQLTAAMFKSLGASNAFIGYTSFLYLPWSIKFLWGPNVDAFSTKRNWVLWMQLAMTLCFGAVGALLALDGGYSGVLAVLTLVAFLSATHDIATDGFYLHALSGGEQAFFSGIRSAFYRLAMIVSGGLLVTLAGNLAPALGSLQKSWALSFGIAALIFLALTIYHKLRLPVPASDKPVRGASLGATYGEAFRTYFRQRKIVVILAFILLFRFGEGMLLKMAQPFMLDAVAKGGLGLSLQEVGFMYGTIGVLALVLGGIAGGWLIEKYGLRKMIWLLVLSMHLPNLLFIYMAITQPQGAISLDLSALGHLIGLGNWAIGLRPVVQTCIIIEQLGYGLGFTAFMVFLLDLSQGEYKTSHYAISTGIMALGMIIPGLLSGIVQQSVGYIWLFVTSSMLTIPGMLLIFFLPIREKQSLEV